ncbi:peptidase [Peptoniphilus lacrimalis DNF00528]|nr:peptidase [Peptoniphilus lacrimalis DNF00528]
MKKLNKILAIILFTAILFTDFIPVLAISKSSEDISKKLSENLIRSKNDEFFDVIVKLKKEVNSQRIKNDVKNANAEKSKEELQKEIRKEIVNESKELAKSSQASILEILKNEKNKGNVKSYESFFIINCVNLVARKSVIVELAKRDDVEKIIENKVIKVEKPEKNEKIRMSRSAYDIHIPWNLKAINAYKAQRYTKDCNNEVVVGIIDSGVDSTHSAISKNYRGNDSSLAAYSWYNTINGKDGSQEKPYDDRGHGTHVCGTILGSKENALLGVAPKAKWIGVKVFDQDGETNNVKLLKAGEWIMAPNGDPTKAPKVVNNSWGGNSNDGFFQEIVKKWREAGIFPVFSAGNVGPFNDGGDDSIGTPGAYPESYAVGAIRKDEHIAKFSLRGKSTYTNKIKPDIVAPGVNILSCIPGEKYTIYTGTSMAAPHVTGVIALMLQVNPNLTVDQIENILNETALPLKDEYYTTTPNNGYGYGKVNAVSAVQLAKGQEKGKDIKKDNIAILSGRLLAHGQDTQAPVISHNPINKIFTTYKTTFDVDAKDNTGVKSVKLLLDLGNGYKSYDLELKRGNKVDGYYSTNIPVETFKGVSEGKYYIEVIDINDKVTKTPVYPFEVQKGIGIGYVNNFESDISGFDFGGEAKLFKWGKIKSDESNNKVIGIEPYDKIRGNSIVVMPPIDLAGENRKAALTFKHWYDLGNSENAFFDTAEIWIAQAKEDSDPDTLQWKLKRTYKNSSKGWANEYIDLSEYFGKKICIMFGFRPNGEWKSEGKGWYIDDLKVEEVSKEVPEKPSKDLSLLKKKEGRIVYSFSSIENDNITAYELYRSKSENSGFECIKTVLKGDEKNGFGKYSIDLSDTPKPQKGTYYYYAVAKIGDNKSEPSEIKSVTFTEGKEFKSFDFENGEEGWTSSINGDEKSQWEFGNLKYGDQYSTQYKKPIEKQSLGKNDGMNMWATNMNDYRSPKTKYALVSPSMDLSSLSDGTLYYQNWFGSSGKRYSDDYDTYNQDIGEIYFSKDAGKTWEKFYTLDEKNLEKDGIIHAWFTNKVEIPKDYLVKDFKVKFLLETGSDTGSSDSAQSGGWYIDDVTINSKNLEDKNIVIDKNPAPFKLTNLQRPASENKSVLPLSGKIIIAEQNSLAKVIATVQTEPGTGAFSIKLPVGDYLIVGSADGYKNSKHDYITLKKDGLNKDIYLEKAGGASVTVNLKDYNYDEFKGLGKVTLYKKGEIAPIAEKEGVNVTFENLYPGKYQFIVNSDGFKKIEQEFTLDDHSRPFDVRLHEKIYPQKESSVGYTDVTPLELAGMDLKNRAFANKITNDKIAQIKEISYFITKTKDVDLKGSKYRISIYDKNDDDELPGKILFSKDLTFEKEGWNKIDVSNVQVWGDYYIAFTKLDGNLALGIDNKRENTMSYQMFNDAWDEPDTKGTYMIGAKVEECSDKENKEKCTISFDSNGGSGKMESIEVDKKSNYIVPECIFTAPEGKEFRAWQVYTKEIQAGESQYVFENVTFKALWKDKKTENKEKLEPVMPFPMMGQTNVTNFEHFITYKNETESDEYLKSIEKVIVKHKGKTQEITGAKGIDSTDFMGNANKKLAFPFDSKLDKDDTITIVSSKYKNVLIKILDVTDVGNDIYYTLSANVEGQKIVRIIHFDANGGTNNMKDVEVENGTIYSLPECTITPPKGYEFKAWEYLGDESEVGHKYQINNDVTIKAIWKKIATNNITIHYDSNAGQGEMPDESKLENEKFIIPESKFTPPQGKEFDAWEINGQRKYPGEELVLSENITLKALWTQKLEKTKDPVEPILTEVKSDDPSYTKENCKHFIGYKKEDRAYIDAINLITIKHDGKIIKKYLLTKEDGKYVVLDGTGKTKKDMTSIVFNSNFFFNRDDEIIICARGYKDLRLHIASADDMVMNALYTTEIISRVKFETFDGSKVDDQVIKVTPTWAENVKKPKTDPTKDGYIFKGWYKDSDCKENFDFNSKIISDTSIYAKWEKEIKKFTISFIGNGGTGEMNTIEKDKDQKYILPISTFIPAEGKEFDAWEINGQRKSPGEEIIINSDTQIKAIWKDKIPTPGPKVEPEIELKPSPEIKPENNDGGNNNKNHYLPWSNESKVQKDTSKVNSIVNSSEENNKFSENTKTLYTIPKDAQKHWAKEAIEYCLSKGYFKDIVKDQKFEPEKQITRGEFITILARFAGAKESNTKISFTDIDKNMYYAPFVAWAKENNITAGTGIGKFSPDKPISRAEMTTMLYRFLKSIKIDLKSLDKNIDFKDKDKIPSWAKEAIKEMVDFGILNGNDDGTFNPKGKFKRCQMSQIIYNLSK